MIRTVSREPDKEFRISGPSHAELPKATFQAHRVVSISTDAGSRPARVVEMAVDAHEYFARLGDYFVAKFGDPLATVKAQMVFDACGPGRDIDPQSLFQDDSDGDSWAEAISSLNI